MCRVTRKSSSSEGMDGLGSSACKARRSTQMAPGRVTWDRPGERQADQVGGCHHPDDKAWARAAKEGHGDWQKQLGPARVSHGTQSLVRCEVNWILRALNP